MVTDALADLAGTAGLGAVVYYLVLDLRARMDRLEGRLTTHIDQCTEVKRHGPDNP